MWGTYKIIQGWSTTGCYTFHERNIVRIRHPLNKFTRTNQLARSGLLSTSCDDARCPLAFKNEIMKRWFDFEPHFAMTLAAFAQWNFENQALLSHGDKGANVQCRMFLFDVKVMSWTSVDLVAKLRFVWNTWLSAILFKCNDSEWDDQTISNPNIVSSSDMFASLNHNKTLHYLQATSSSRNKCKHCYRLIKI
jgi:hypothetical protein